MIEEPKVTVLMPVYNAEKYLAQAIDSILNQTFTHFEFLIIDDGSSDSSLSIIKSYDDPRIRLVVNERNLGISATLNNGIQLSRGPLIARMDADDISYPQRLEKQHDFFIRNPDVALLSAWTREVTINGSPVNTEKFVSEYYYYMLTFQCWIYHPSVVYKREAVIDVGMYSTPYSEDFDLWWQLSRKYKIANMPEVLIDYRLSDESLCKVTKKTEYEEAQYNQVVRNINYYTGSSFPLDYEEIECFKYNCEPLLKKKNVNAILNCLKKLDYISNCINNKENVNLNKTDIDNAAGLLKNSIIEFFRNHLSYGKAASLLLGTRSWRLLFQHVRNFKKALARDAG
jgi:glycosyltransferase involved in cell wall biosynthesis